MKKLLLSTLLIFVALGCTEGRQSVTAINKEAEVEGARMAIMGFAGSLKGALQEAMKEGGPANAITVCNTKAMDIARKASEEHGYEVSRVSLKNRNPGNVPNAWQEEVLEDFEARKLKGEDVGNLTYADVAETGKERQFRFMKAIGTEPICLVCHGSEISPEIKARLNELYPGDRARGFAVGDIRGAFVVTRDFPL